MFNAEFQCQKRVCIVRSLEQKLVLSPGQTADPGGKNRQAGIQAVYGTHCPLIVNTLSVFLLLQALCELGINDL